jgi:hypothetical protein
MKTIYRHKRVNRRLLAPWRREAADIEGLKPGGELAGRLAELREKQVNDTD